MTFLLDTHVWFWAVESPTRLGVACRHVIEDTSNELAVASVSTLEVGQLAFSGRVRLKGTVETWSQRATRSLSLQTFDMTPAIAATAYSLPGSLHKDPADRILIATAVQHGCVLLTADERLLAYPHVMSRDARQ